MSIGQGAKGEAQRAKSKEQRAKALGMSEIEAAIQAHHERNCELLKLIASKGVDPVCRVQSIFISGRRAKVRRKNFQRRSKGADARTFL